jgi:uncharacterized caspase-like protein
MYIYIIYIYARTRQQPPAAAPVSADAAGTGNARPLAPENNAVAETEKAVAETEKAVVEGGQEGEAEAAVLQQKDEKDKLLTATPVQVL